MFILLLVLLLAFPNRVSAQTKIEFKLVGNYFDKDNNLEVEITTSFDSQDEPDLKVRPRIEPDQVLFIYAGDGIFSLGSFWTDLPSIPNQLTLHAPVPFDAADLWFEVLDVQTGKTYETPKKQILGRRFAQSYISDLNKNLFGW